MATLVFFFYLKKKIIVGGNHDEICNRTDDIFFSSNIEIRNSFHNFT